jgi:mRNA interferase MazF
MTSARLGDVWLIDFGVPVGHEQGWIRPGVVVSADMLNQSPSGVVIVVPFTTTRRGLSLHVEVEPGASGLRETSYARCEDTKSVSIERLVRRFGAVEAETLAALRNVLRLVLEL